MTVGAVPVSMGSPRFGTWDAGSALVTLLSFPGRAVLAPHTHERATLAVILAGGFELVLTRRAGSGLPLACPAGTILTQPAGERHVNRFGAEGARGVVLQPNLDAAALPGDCLRFLETVNHFRDGSIAAAARRLEGEVVSPDGVTPLVVESLVLEMLATASRRRLSSPLDPGRAPRWLATATDYVHDRFRETVRIGEVAAVAGVHPAHLAAVFRRFHRLSVGAYVRRLRVDWAAERLSNTGIPIAVIAAEAGFADQAHLTRWFVRMTGRSPAEFRCARRIGRETVADIEARPRVTAADHPRCAHRSADDVAVPARDE